MKLHRSLLLLALYLAAGALTFGLLAAAPPTTAPASHEDLFQRRIAPILASPNPSSCTQCHLASVDLKDYILPTSRLTFLSLRDQGLVDLAAPEKSRILQFIAMTPKDQPGDRLAGTRLIDPKMRQAELDAFSSWIIACAQDPALRNAPPLKPEERAAAKPVEIIRHTRTDAVMASFNDNIWSQRFRCAACHQDGGSETARLVKENGDILWLAKTPEETLQRLLKKNLIDLKQPEKSVLLAKPALLVAHGGGRKMEIGDDGYKAFRNFLEDYARITVGSYAKPADLPASSSIEHFGSEIWLKLDATPPAWADKVAEVRLYAWDPATRDWEKSPVALANRAVAGQAKLWQHSLILQAPAGSPRAKDFAIRPVLPAGRYLVKVYIDTTGKRAANWLATLDEKDFVGQAEAQSQWPSGYGAMTVIPANRIKAP